MMAAFVVEFGVKGCQSFARLDFCWSRVINVEGPKKKSLGEDVPGWKRLWELVIYVWGV